MQESEVLELKRELTSNIVKEIVAFLNTKSGTILIGVEDDGTIVGLNDIKKDEEALANMIRTDIEPSAVLFVSINSEKFEDKEYLVVQVSKGTEVYYVANKGALKGVYTRVGTTSAACSQDVIKDLLIKSKAITFEKIISPNQELSFNYAKDIFKQYDIDILDEHMQKTLHLRDLNGSFNNLAKLISDQNESIIKVAVYKDESKRNFVDKKTFGGSVFEIYFKVLDYLKLNSSTYGIIEGSVRKDIEEYPTIVLRELLLNSIVHRKYELSIANFINIYKDSGKIEFLSAGGLYSITLLDALAGVSSCRNPLLQAIFMRLNLVESLGSGLRRCSKIYEDNQLNIEIEALPSSFRVTIPKFEMPNAKKDSFDKDKSKLLIINYLKEHNYATRKELESLINKEKVTLVTYLNELIDNNDIEKIGSGKNTKYKIK